MMALISHRSLGTPKCAPPSREPVQTVYLEPLPPNTSIVLASGRLAFNCKAFLLNCSMHKKPAAQLDTDVALHATGS